MNPNLDDDFENLYLKSSIMDAKFRHKLKKKREILDQNSNMLIRLMEIENRGDIPILEPKP